MKKRRSKRCRSCGGLFRPDPRSKGRQRYCSGEACQLKRQRRNERLWRLRNPECLAYQYELSRAWFKSHPTYSRMRREKDPHLKQLNRQSALTRMRRHRSRKWFDKSKSILLELTGNKGDKCYLSASTRWLHIRLTKASRFPRWRALWENRFRIKPVTGRLPRSKIYDLTEEIFNRPP